MLDSLFSAVDDGSVTATKKLKSGAVAVEEAILKRSRRDADLPAVPAVSFLRQVVDIPKFSKNALSETPAPRVRRLEVYVDTALVTFISSLIYYPFYYINARLIYMTTEPDTFSVQWNRNITC